MLIAAKPDAQIPMATASMISTNCTHQLAGVMNHQITAANRLPQVPGAGRR